MENTDINYRGLTKFVIVFQLSNSALNRVDMIKPSLDNFLWYLLRMGMHNTGRVKIKPS